MKSETIKLNNGLTAMCITPEAIEIDKEVTRNLLDGIHYAPYSPITEGTLTVSDITLGQDFFKNLYLSKEEKLALEYTPKKVIFNNPATIVYWQDGTKTVVKVSDEEYDPEGGFTSALAKKIFGSRSRYGKIIEKLYKKHLEEEGKKDEKKLKINL